MDVVHGHRVGAVRVGVEHQLAIAGNYHLMTPLKLTFDRWIIQLA